MKSSTLGYAAKVSGLVVLSGSMIPGPLSCFRAQLFEIIILASVFDFVQEILNPER